MLKTSTTVFLFLCLCNQLAAQSSIDWEKEFEQLEKDMDSLSIFFLLDSVIQTEIPKLKSSLNFNLNYNSNIDNASDYVGTNFKYLSPGISFYHHSGAFIDYSGYINTDETLNYDQSVLTTGYLFAKKNWTLTPHYGLWLYHDSTKNIRQNANLSLTYRKPYGYVNLRYGYFFGNENTHRVIGTIGGTINLGKLWIFDQVKLIPFVSAYYGNYDVYITSGWDNLSEEDQISELYDLYEGFIFSEDIRNKLSFLHDERTYRIYQNENLTTEQKTAALTYIYTQYTAINDSIESYKTYSSEFYGNYERKYGVFNYSLNIPIMIRYKDFTSILSYTYSIPRDLPGEDLNLSPTNYFGISISYSFDIKRKK